MKGPVRCVLFILCLSFSFAQADSSIFIHTTDKPITEVYDKVYKSLEEARFYVVFEPNIGKNLPNAGAINTTGTSSARFEAWCSAADGMQIRSATRIPACWHYARCI